MKYTLLLCLLLLFCILSGNAQDTAIIMKPKSATLTGRIVSDTLGTGIPGMLLTLPRAKVITTTDSLGYFVFEQVPFGNHFLLIQLSPLLTDSVVFFVNRAVFNSGNVLVHLPEPVIDSLPTQIFFMTSDENTASADEDAAQRNLGLFTWSRDPFLSIASFNLSPLNFRLRGYDNHHLEVYLNGLALNDAEGSGFFATQLGGLNEVLNDRSVSYGLQADESFLGGLTGSSTIVLNPSARKKGSAFSYANGNRTYRHRLFLAHHTGMMSNGWALSVAASRRWANEGYVAGTSLNSYAFYLGLSRKIGKRGMLHVNAIGAPTLSATAAAVTREAMDLAGSVYYNPNWGVQNGVKRSARENDFFQPLFLLNYETNAGRATTINVSALFQTGHNSVSSLDWYNAPDPRPDYYQNLPSFWMERDQPDPGIAEAYRQQWLNDETVPQINWNRLYDRNRVNSETINGVTAKRSRYVLGQDRKDMDKYAFALNIKRKLGAKLNVTGGASMAIQQVDNYKKMLDLLGGDFYVNLNQFAESQFVGNAAFRQLDLNNPDKLVRVGDKYNYHYRSSFKNGAIWMQSVFSGNNIQLFLAGRAAVDEYSRDGQYRNGLFPNDSYGRSKMQTFYSYQLKGGISYPINSHNTIYLNGEVLTLPPHFANTFISPKTRNASVDQPLVESIQAMEAGYLLQSARWNGRLTAFAADIKDGAKIQRFYYEDYTSFVNYVMRGINLRHTGLELAMQANLTKHFTATFAASYMQVFYTSRPEVSIYRDNDTADIVGKTTVYMQDYFAGVGPQSAYGLGLSYRSLQRWFASVNFNYLHRNYIEMNPTRLTAEAVDLLPPGSETWRAIRRQDELPAVFTIDIFAGKSFLLYKKLRWLKNKTTLNTNIGVNNLLNNRKAISGSQQLRFDYVDKNPDQFPDKYRYGFGATYFVSIALSF